VNLTATPTLVVEHYLCLYLVTLARRLVCGCQETTPPVLFVLKSVYLRSGGQVC